MDFASERLRELRVLNGCTLEAVAERIGVTKQAVSQFETGKMVPATDTIIKIMDLYGINRSLLTNSRGIPKEKSIAFYRKKARTPKKEQEEAEVYLKWFYEIVAVTGQMYPIEQIDLPEFPLKATVAEKAELLRKHWEIGEKPIADVITLLEKHGFYFFSVAMRESNIDGYSQMIGDTPIIVLNKNKGTKERCQFSVAHELGHLVLHRNSEAVYDDMEREADEFAGCFLMPERAIRADLVRDDAEYFRNLARKWNVSPQAIVERCKRLGLLGIDAEMNKAKASALYQRLNKAKEGKATVESEGVEICSIRAALRQIEADEGTAQNFLRNLCFPIKEIQRLCCWKDGFEKYGETESLEAVSEIEGVQLSLNFE